MKWIIKNVSTITKISKRTKFNKFRLFKKGKSQMHFVFFGLLPKKDESDIIVPVKRALMLLKSYILGKCIIIVLSLVRMKISIKRDQ